MKEFYVGADTRTRKVDSNIDGVDVYTWMVFLYICL